MSMRAVVWWVALLAAATTAAQAQDVAGPCANAPKARYGTFNDCPLPAKVGQQCQATCSKNKVASFASVPAPVATCTDKGWTVEHECKRVCMGAPDAALLKTVDAAAADWPASCADVTPVGEKCVAPCKNGPGSVSVLCGVSAAWGKEVVGSCAAPAEQQQQQQQQPAAAAAQPSDTPQPTQAEPQHHDGGGDHHDDATTKPAEPQHHDGGDDHHDGEPQQLATIMGTNTQKGAVSAPANKPADGVAKKAAPTAKPAGPSETVTCAQKPSVAFGEFRNCPVPAPVGHQCSATCNKDARVSGDSRGAAPVATCTGRGWAVTNMCSRVCVGKPDASLLRLVGAEATSWPESCKDATLVGANCQVKCKDGPGVADVQCGPNGWAATLSSTCASAKKQAPAAPPASKAQPAPGKAPAPTPAPGKAPAPAAAPAAAKPGNKQAKATPPPPTCAGRPKAIANGAWPVDCAGATRGAACKAACRSTDVLWFNKTGTPTVSCLPSGQWSDPKPAQCVQMPAPLPTLEGVLVDGTMSGGSPRALATRTVNFFDPGRVLLRPPAFMSLPVANENGNTGIPISTAAPDGAGIEFGAFAGTKDYQVATLADFGATDLNVTLAHAGGNACLEATALAFTSPSFGRLQPSVTKVVADGFARALAPGSTDKVRVSLRGNTLNVWVPPVCVRGPEGRLTAIVRLLV